MDAIYSGQVIATTDAEQAIVYADLGELLFYSIRLEM